MRYPKIMGILNITPNSYYDGGKYFEPCDAINHGLKLIDEGADILDVGGCSTKPGSTPPTIEEEIRRIEYVIKKLREKTDITISIDTYRPKVALSALEAGANFINDITGFQNPEMIEVAAHYQVPICIMHIQNMPKNMQNAPFYPKGVICEIFDFLENRTQTVIKQGIKNKNIFIDPGIGFGKTLDENFEIMQNLTRFRELGHPILLGISRKSFLYKMLKLSPADVLPATIALSSLVAPNVDVFRVHDVKEHSQMVEVLKTMNDSHKTTAF